MTENEKMDALEQEQTSALSEQTCPENPTNEQADAEAVCSEESSPALELAQAADKEEEVKSEALPESEALEAEEAAELSHIQEIHKLSKQELVDRLKKILEDDDMQAHRDVTLMKQAFFNIRKRETDEECAAFVEAGNGIDAFAATPCQLENEFKELLADFKSRRAAFLEKEEEERQENLAKKLRTIDAIKALTEDIDNINRNYQEFQRLQQEFKEIKNIPQQAESEIWKQYQSVVEQFYDLLKLNKELRDLDFKKNLEAKRELIAQAKALTEMTDAIKAERQLQVLHNQWREIGPVAKDIREEIWEEFRTASTVVNRRHQEYFLQRKAEEQKNEEAKTKLCEQMEAISFEGLESFADWDKVADSIKALQAEWKKLGFASRKTNNALFARFRKRIDEFFALKSEFFQKKREEMKQNLRRKEELCEKAEAIAAEENARDDVRRVKALMDEWKTVGPVERKQSDLVWQRFLKASNVVYDRRRKETDARRSEEKANLEVKKRIVADLQAMKESGEKDPAKLRALQEEWRATGHVAFSKKEALNNSYFDLVRELNGSNGQRRQQRGGGPRFNPNLSPADQLAEKIRQKKNDLLTYENNMGFFNVKSAAGNSMLAELERKIARIKEEIADYENQLRDLRNAENQ